MSLLTERHIKMINLDIMHHKMKNILNEEL